MTPRSGSTYIQDGHITRPTNGTHRRRHEPAYRIFWFRLILLMAVLAVLLVTNPANGLGHWIPNRYWYTSDTQQGSFWFSLIRPQDTNYGLFQLSRTIDGVFVSGLMNTVQLCEFDSPQEDELISLVCGWIGTRLVLFLFHYNLSEF